ncbi:hypothetical protein O181_030315 [Austropuccinia psidii MF-1]|uniref:Uncharacterized protein n=1 Tax=Austropuccinia psidii MF-1 TaxID=1389203 RepID=A0A9Q3H644_9BASI|nr:hypothetical protein [Austropuccinia psidii MF-1]
MFTSIMWKGLTGFFTQFWDNKGPFPHPALEFLCSTTVKSSYTLVKKRGYNYSINYCSSYYMEENFIPLETQPQANIPVTPSEPEGSKVKGKKHSEGLITKTKWKPIATQRSRKSQNSASIQGKATLINCTGKITIINLVVTSKGKFPKEVDNEFLQGTFEGTLEYEGTSQRTEKACPEPEDLEEDTLDTVKPQSRGLEGYGSISSAPPTHQRPMQHGQEVVQPSIPLGRTWIKLPEDMSQRDRLQRPYGNQQRLEPHQAVQTPGGEGNQDKGESSHYPSYIGQTSSPVASHNSGTNRSVAKSHHSSHSQVVSRRRHGYKGNNKTSFSQRQRESGPMIQKLLDLVKEVHKRQK